VGVVELDQGGYARLDDAFGLKLDLLFEPLLLCRDLGFRSQPVSGNLALGSACSLPDLVSPLPNSLFVPPACHFILL